VNILKATTPEALLREEQLVDEVVEKRRREQGS
jgi:hypothetical protein